MVLLTGTAAAEVPKMAEVPALPAPNRGASINKVDAAEAYAALPTYFVENGGQIDSRVAFYAQESGASIYFTSQEVVLVLPQGVLRTRFLGANPDVRISASDEREARFSYLIGDNSESWHRELRTYGEITYHNLYPGVDLTYTGRDNALKYEFVLQEEGDVEAIQLASPGVESLREAANGDLLVLMEGSQTPLRDVRPYAYQDINGTRVHVGASYTLHGENTFGFSVDAYDPQYPLTIDPELYYGTFLGGEGSERASGIAVDSANNVYVTGHTHSYDFPATEGAYDPSLNASYLHSRDVFVSVFDPTLSTLLHSTFLGGRDRDDGNGIALDSQGNVYVVGATESSDFPSTAGAYDTTFNGGGYPFYSDAFVSVLDSTLSTLQYSTFLGGSFDGDEGQTIAFDRVGNV
jgi:hypothetical protein